MKTIFLALSLVSSAAFAAQPSLEAKTVVRALLHSPNVTRVLKREGIDSIQDVVITAMKNGVNEYYIKLGRECFCLPATANVYITEDMRPTFADGAPIYNSTVTIERN